MNISEGWMTVIMIAAAVVGAYLVRRWVRGTREGYVDYLLHREENKAKMQEALVSRANDGLRKHLEKARELAREDIAKLGSPYEILTSMAKDLSPSASQEVCLELGHIEYCRLRLGVLPGGTLGLVVDSVLSDTNLRESWMDEDIVLSRLDEWGVDKKAIAEFIESDHRMHHQITGGWDDDISRAYRQVIMEWVESHVMADVGRWVQENHAGYSTGIGKSDLRPDWIGDSDLFHNRLGFDERDTVGILTTFTVYPYGHRGPTLVSHEPLSDQKLVDYHESQDVALEENRQYLKALIESVFANKENQRHFVEVLNQVVSRQDLLQRKINGTTPFLVRVESPVNMEIEASISLRGLSLKLWMHGWTNRLENVIAPNDLYRLVHAAIPSYVESALKSVDPCFTVETVPFKPTTHDFTVRGDDRKIPHCTVTMVLGQDTNMLSRRGRKDDS